jgi:hypothetical protein
MPMYFHFVFSFTIFRVRQRAFFSSHFCLLRGGFLPLSVGSQELFPRGAIEYYTNKNMGRPVSEADTAKW